MENTLDQELLERIVALESAIDQEKNNRLKNFAAMASATALVISIMSGILGLYNTFFVAPDLEVKVAARALSVEIDQHRQKVDEFNALPRFVTPAQRSVAKGAVTWGQAAIMGTVKASPPEVLESLGATDLIALAWIAMQAEEPALSEKLALLGVDRAATFGDQMTAKATLAQSVFFFDPPRGEELFNALFKEIAESNSLNRSSAFAGAASQMGQVYAMKRDCTGLSEWWKNVHNTYLPTYPVVLPPFHRTLRRLRFELR